MPQRKIHLGKIYLTTFGKEFTPVKKILGKIKPGQHPDKPNPQRLESRFEDKNGNVIKKSKLTYLKE